MSVFVGKVDRYRDLSHGTQIRRHHYGEFLSADRQKFTEAVPSNFVVVHLCVYQVTLVHSTHQLSHEDRHL
jgi:hypothetical protein